MKAFFLVCISVLFIHVPAFSQVDTIPHTRNRIKLKQMVNLLENLNVKDDSTYLTNLGYYEIQSYQKKYYKDTIQAIYHETGKTERMLDLRISQNKLISVHFISLYCDDLKEILKEAEKFRFKESAIYSKNAPFQYRTCFTNSKYKLDYTVVGKELKTYQVRLYYR